MTFRFIRIPWNHTDIMGDTLRKHLKMGEEVIQMAATRDEIILLVGVR